MCREYWFSLHSHYIISASDSDSDIDRASTDSKPFRSNRIYGGVPVTVAAIKLWLSSVILSAEEPEKETERERETVS